MSVIYGSFRKLGQTISFSMTGEQSFWGQGAAEWHPSLERQDYACSWLVYAEIASKSSYEFFDKFIL